MAYNIVLRSSGQASRLTKSTAKDFYFGVKRILDLILAMAALLILAPVIVLVAVLIKLDSSGPIIYSQKRLGAYRKAKHWQLKPFTFYKFRTMKANSDSAVHNRYMKAYITGDESPLSEMQMDSKNEKVS